MGVWEAVVGRTQVGGTEQPAAVGVLATIVPSEQKFEGGGTHWGQVDVGVEEEVGVAVRFCTQVGGIGQPEAVGVLATIVPVEHQPGAGEEY